jgi:hypothetical protein
VGSTSKPPCTISNERALDPRALSICFNAETSVQPARTFHAPNAALLSTSQRLFRAGYLLRPTDDRRTLVPRIVRSYSGRRFRMNGACLLTRSRQFESLQSAGPMVWFSAAGASHSGTRKTRVAPVTGVTRFAFWRNDPATLCRRVTTPARTFILSTKPRRRCTRSAGNVQQHPVPTSETAPRPRGRFAMPWVSQRSPGCRRSSVG